MTNIPAVQISEYINQENIERLTLIVTRGCNLSCEYCFEKHFKEQKMEVAKAIGLVERYKPKVVKFFGGEPLMNLSLIRTLIDWYPDMMFEMTTNATFIKKLEPEYWKRFSSVNVSIDGAFERDNLRWTNYNLYKEVLDNIRYLNYITNGKVIINITLSSDTMYDYSILERSLDLYALTGINKFDINLVIFDSDNKLRLTKQDQDEFIIQSYEVFQYSVIETGAFDLTINETIFAQEGSMTNCCAYRSKNQVAVNVDGYESHCHVAAYQQVNQKEFHEFSEKSLAACPILDWNAKENNISLDLNSEDFKRLARIEQLNGYLYRQRSNQRNIRRP